MRLDKRRLILILLAVSIFGIGNLLAQEQDRVDTNVVGDFQVTDVPADDGTGLILSWEPLPREKRIIEYRIYRGISPDQLFFLESIQVNPKSGVASDRMYYYDNSYTEISDPSFPAKMKLEKDQAEDGILYGRPPRDFRFTATLVDKFQMISLSKRNDFYFKSQKVLREHEPEEGPSDSWAGLKANQQTIVAGLIPGMTYYYTVLAVDERQNYLPYAEVSSGVPMPNAPEAAPALYSVLMEDTQDLRFEWEYPIYKGALAAYTILRLPALSEAEWQNLKQDPEAVQAAAEEMAHGRVKRGILPNYTKVEVGDEIGTYKDARFAIRLTDVYGSSSLSSLSTPRIMNSDALPPQIQFQVEDKPNDKGDRLTVVWDHPIVFITKTTALKSDYTKIRVNYQLNQTDNQRVDTIWFEFFDPETDASIAKIKEFYQDNSVVLKLPEDYDYKKGLKVKINLEGLGVGLNPIPPEYTIEQMLGYDPAMMALLPEKAIYRNDLDVSKIYNVVYRKYRYSPDWNMVMRNTSYDNSLDVPVPYPSMSQKLVYGFSYPQGDSLYFYFNNGERFVRARKNSDRSAPVSLMSHEVDFTWDNANKVMITTSLFEDEAQRMYDEAVAETEAAIASLEEQKTQLTAAEQIAAIDAEIAEYQAFLNAYTQNEKLQQMLKMQDNRNRVKAVIKAADQVERAQTYMVVKTDRKGLFVETYPEMTDGEYIYHTPVSNWFDTNKWVTLIATLLFVAIVVVFVQLAKRGKDLYIRPIAGLQEIDNAIGRATEMGRPMLYCMGNGSISDVATIASMGILSLVARKAAEYDTKLIVPCYDYIIMPIAQEIVREAHYAVGRPDTFDRNNVFYLTNVQFAYVAGVNGIMIRERMATNFFMGYFAAEALLMTETGNAVGAVQIAGTDAVTQIPFFITTCDYTLIGEELYAASAYLNREPMLLGTLKAQDYFKFIIILVVVVGAVLSSFELTGLTLLMPEK